VHPDATQQMVSAEGHDLAGTAILTVLDRMPAILALHRTGRSGIGCGTR